MKSYRTRMALLFTLAVTLGACASDCQSGYVCAKFSDGKTYCGSGQGTSQCRVLGYK